MILKTNFAFDTISIWRDIYQNQIIILWFHDQYQTPYMLGMKQTKLHCPGKKL